MKHRIIIFLAGALCLASCGGEGSSSESEDPAAVSDAAVTVVTVSEGHSSPVTDISVIDESIAPGGDAAEPAKESISSPETVPSGSVTGSAAAAGSERPVQTGSVSSFPSAVSSSPEQTASAETEASAAETVFDPYYYPDDGKDWGPLIPSNS